MITTIKIKDLTLEFLEKTCRKYNKCYQCPLNKLNIPCARMPQFSDEELEQEIKLNIEVSEDE